MKSRVAVRLLVAGALLGSLSLLKGEVRTPYQGESWGARWTAPQGIAPGEFQEYPDVAVDGGGRAWVAWISVSSGREHVMLRSYKGLEASEPLDVGAAGGVLQFAPRVIASGRSVWVAWSVRDRKGGLAAPWQIAVRQLIDGQPGPLEILSSASESALRPALGLDNAGKAWVAWESRAGKQFRILARPLEPRDGRTPALDVGIEGELNLRPAITAAPEGGVYILWDQYRSGNYHVLARRADDTLHPIIHVSDEPGENQGPSAVTDAAGRVYVAYATSADGRGGRRVGKTLRLKVLDAGRVLEVAGGPPPRVETAPNRLDAVEFPTTTLDPAGRIWIFARRGQGFIAFRYEGNQWFPPVDLSEKGWGGRGRELRAAWSPDGFHLVARRLHLLAHQLFLPPSGSAPALALATDASPARGSEGLVPPDPRAVAETQPDPAQPPLLSHDPADVAPMEGVQAPEPVEGDHSPYSGMPPSATPAQGSIPSSGSLTPVGTPTPVPAGRPAQPRLSQPPASIPASVPSNQAAPSSQVYPAAPVMPRATSPGTSLASLGVGLPVGSSEKVVSSKTRVAAATSSKGKGTSGASHAASSQNAPSRSGTSSRSGNASSSRSGKTPPSSVTATSPQSQALPLGARSYVIADGVGPPRPSLPSAWRPAGASRVDPPLPSGRPKGYFFGDLHTHTWLSDGAGEPDEVYTRSRDQYRFDFASVTDHDVENGNRLLPSEWAWIELITDFFNEPGKFVTMVSYEWTSLSYPKGAGHRNIYFPGEDVPLYNCVDDAPESKTLFQLVRQYGGVAGAHHIGWTGTDWENHDPTVQRFMEIVSVHGAFEKPGNRPILPRAELAGGFIRDGLGRGLRFALIGGSDGHGFPWHYGVSRKEDVWRTGLTGLKSNTLDRAALYDALRSRQTIATSGPPISVWFYANGQPLGSEQSTDQPPRFDIRVEGTAPLASVTLVRDGEDIRALEVRGSSLETTIFDEPSPGDHYYYLRAVQTDGEAAWATPVWLELKGRILVGPPDP